MRSEELHKLEVYSSHVLLSVDETRMRLAGHECDEFAHKMLIIKPQGKRLLVRPKRRWQYNIKKNLSEIVFQDWDYLQLADYKVCISCSSTTKVRKVRGR
jgi:hypothetical protein